MGSLHEEVVVCLNEVLVPLLTLQLERSHFINYLNYMSIKLSKLNISLQLKMRGQALRSACKEVGPGIKGVGALV